MSQAPAMPLLWGDYWSKTRKLSPTQHHAYLFLLGATWMNNCQPFADDDEVLARVIGISLKSWKAIRPALAGFFSLSEGTWRNAKLEEVWADVSRRIEANRKNGPRGGRPKKPVETLPAGMPRQGVDVFPPEDNQIQKTEENQLPGKPMGSVSVNPNHNPMGTQPEPNQNQIKKEGKEGSVGSNEPTGAAPPLLVVAGTEHTPAPDPQKALFDFGKEVLGPKAGGVIAKLLLRHGGDVAATIYTLRLAKGKQSPAEYVGAILRGAKEPETDWDAEYLRMGVRPDGSSVGDDTWVPPLQRPGDDGDDVRSIA